ncbi:uncharacterized protein LOC101857356 [Aplysia californica]|uniref:Uncharacterized protein LOC101857356 n=1 Tax=Aplysia californica TaxID=6500 RepID=A0ABM0K1G6_APLCA|nr:uncharacterized protein LOC101857356 [Aplysia californica]
MVLLRLKVTHQEYYTRTTLCQLYLCIPPPRDYFRLSVPNYQEWFQESVVFWLHMFRAECNTRVHRALEIDRDVNMTTLRRSFLSIEVLCLAIIFIPSHAEVIHKFATIDYEWPNATALAQSLANGDFASKTGVVSHSDVKGIPPGLTTVVKCADGKSVLRPYPNWDAQKIGDCSALQLPMSMAINPNTGYLYVIDIGRVGISSPNPTNLCPAKLIVYDTVLGGSTILSYEFPDSVVSRTTNYLNDIVLDYVNPKGACGVKYAYMTDTMTRSLVVYDFSHKSWVYKDPVSMGTDNDQDITIHGIIYPVDVGVGGIAMSPHFQLPLLLFCRIQEVVSRQVHTWVLRTPGNDFVSTTRLVGSKKSQGGGMVFGHKGLFFGALEYDAVYKRDMEADVISQGVSEGEAVMETQDPAAQNWQTMQWTDALSLDNESNLYFTTNRLQKFVTNKMDFDGGDGANFRIFKYNVHDKSYLFPAVPERPESIVG